MTGHWSPVTPFLPLRFVQPPSDRERFCSPSAAGFGLIRAQQTGTAIAFSGDRHSEGAQNGAGDRHRKVAENAQDLVDGRRHPATEARRETAIRPPQTQAGSLRRANPERSSLSLPQNPSGGHLAPLPPGGPPTLRRSLEVMFLAMSLKSSGMARISFDGGALLMPARHAYDCELVFEAATSYARRYGAVLLELDGSPISVTSAPAGEDPCSACRRDLGAIAFYVAGHPLCLDCARKAE